MPDLDDFEIDGTKRRAEGDDPEPAPAGPPPGIPRPLLGAAGVVLVAAVALVLMVVRRPPRAPVPASPVAAAPSPFSTPAPTAAALPDLAQSDAFVRQLAAGLSTHPQLGAWLAARDLVRTLTVSIQNVAEGRSPARFLPFLTPTTRFAAVEKTGRLVADPQSHAAYDDFAAGVAALDAAEVVRVYGVLAPLFGAAYAELGYPPADFQKALERAGAVLRDTPVPTGEIALRRGAVFLEFADPRLESLSLAQKQLLRMGPRNARLVQAKAAEILRLLAPPPPS